MKIEELEKQFLKLIKEVDIEISKMQFQINNLSKKISYLDRMKADKALDFDLTDEDAARIGADIAEHARKTGAKWKP